MLPAVTGLGAPVFTMATSAEGATGVWMVAALLLRSGSGVARVHVARVGHRPGRRGIHRDVDRHSGLGPGRQRAEVTGDGLSSLGAAALGGYGSHVGERSR